MSSPLETLVSENKKLETENKELKQLIGELITWHRMRMRDRATHSQAVLTSSTVLTRLHRDMAVAREIIATAEKLKDVLSNNEGARRSHVQINEQQDAIIEVQQEIIDALEQKLGEHQLATRRA
ncbi:hypothetical protein BP5796_03042 [Coleophoma crateriformis]|uniref:Uncharacterized protein n=1 Tax=Coleophoma crateriformis TaxID=565419 RepID=A0A3D8SNH4_9HELO|nr:hypothetical protein BP5796_03042 [Coleophoma crateriformis]